MKHKALFKITSVIGLLCLTAGHAMADVLPGPAMPEQVGRALGETIPEPTQAAPDPIQAPKEPASPISAEAQKIKFQLNGIVLSGNTVYTDAQLKPLYQNALGKTITVAQLFEIVQSITNFYRNNGYIISRAILPPQHVKNGIVNVRIIEGYIGNVEVSGTPRGARCLVLGYGDKIRACRPLQIKRMEKYLLLANEIPSTQVKAVLSPSKKEVGAADMALVTTNKPINGYLSYDNYGTRYIGPQQMTANLGMNSVFGSGDSTQLTVTKTPKGKELTYVDLNYNTPLNSEGVNWLIGGTDTRTHPLFVLQPADINGKNYNYYTMLNYPIIRERTQSLTLRGGFNYLDSFVTTFDQELYTDHIRSLDLGGTYNFSDRWYGANLISGDVRKGLPLFGYSSDDNQNTATTSRPGGRANYSKITLQLSRLQAIKGPFSAYVLLSGQWAFDPLLAAEQFTFGGSQLGRGYDVAELIGDKGAAGSVELRYDLNIGRIIQHTQFYAFYDAGMIWNIITAAGTPGKLSATSTGLGARIFFTKYISGNVMWAKPLTKHVAAEELVDQGPNPRLFFSLVASLDY